MACNSKVQTLVNELNGWQSCRQALIKAQENENNLFTRLRDKLNLGDVLQNREVIEQALKLAIADEVVKRKYVIKDEP